MSKTSMTVGLAMLIAIGIASGYMGWKVYSSSQQDICQVCVRPMHMENKTVVLVDGKDREHFCCPTCARTFARQTGRKVEIVEVNDYVTHSPVDARNATLVEGSDVNPCLQHVQQMTRDQDRQVVPLDFDRCAPSVLAFADRKLAEDFLKVHGGTLVRPDEFIGQQPRAGNLR